MLVEVSWYGYLGLGFKVGVVSALYVIFIGDGVLLGERGGVGLISLESDEDSSDYGLGVV